MTIENSTFGNSEPSSLDSDFQILNNSGATSDTFKVKIYGKWHFLKRPKKEYKSNPIYIAAFEKEFDLGFQLDHPNIVRYIKKEVDNEGLYIITEFVEGLNLQEYLSQHPSLNKDKHFMNKIIHEILSVLDYLHNHQIIHLDIKPENILITNIGKSVKLIDLGFSSSDGYNAIACGTPTYSSPEQFENPSLIDATSDIYSFGKLLIFLCTSSTSSENISKLPLLYRAIAQKCTQSNPKDRYSNIHEIIKSIESSALRRKTITISTIVLSVIILLSISLFLTKRPVPENNPNKVELLNLDGVVQNNLKEYSTKVQVKDLTQSGSVNNTKSSSMSAEITIDKNYKFMDSLFSEFDKKYPKIEISNIFEAKDDYDSIVSSLSNWFDSHINSIDESQRSEFINVLTNGFNQRVEKYYILQNNPIFNHPKEYYKNHMEHEPTTSSNDSISKSKNQ